MKKPAATSRRARLKNTAKKIAAKIPGVKKKVAARPDYRDMVDNAAHGILVHRNFRPLYANEGFAQLFGYKDAAAVAAQPMIRHLIPDDQWARAENDYAVVIRGKQKRGIRRQRMQRADGQEIWLALSERAVAWNGAPAVEWHAFDISAQMHVEQHLLSNEHRLGAVLEVLPYPILVARRADGRILFVNRKTCLLLAQSANGLLKRGAFEFFADDKDPDHIRAMLDAVREMHDMEAKLHTQDGHEFMAEIAAIATDYDGQAAMLLALNDISARKRLEAELFHEASTDALTGIANRRYFITRSEQELRRARRFARDLAVMMIDLDHFKAVNDTHGHAVGDLVLKEAVQASLDGLRATDSMGRLGGEEFAVLMPETDLAEATEVAERLRVRIAARRIAVGKKTLQCTASIGVACLQPRDGDIDALLHRADEALYRAKQGGRDKVVAAI